MPTNSTNPTNYTNPPSQGATNLLGAIATNEGYGVPGTVPTLANNPGAITTSNPKGVGYGVANSAGVINYGDTDTGVSTAYALINTYVQNNPSITLSQFAQKWTHSPDAINNYSNTLGVDPDTPVSLILNGKVPTKTSRINYATSSPPGSKQGTLGVGSQSNSEAPTIAPPSASAYSNLPNNSSNVDLAALVPMIVIQTGLDANPWYNDPGLITGNPRLRQDVQPVTFQVLLQDNNYFILSSQGETGSPVQVQLNASMKSFSVSSKHLYHHQRTRTAHHITMWGMQADIIEGKCTTGIFMNQFGLTDYYSTRNVNDTLKTLVTNSFSSSSSTPSTSGYPTPVGTVTVSNNAEANSNGEVLASDGNLYPVNMIGPNGVIQSAPSGGTNAYDDIMQSASRNNKNFSASNAFRVAAQDAFMEFLALFKMNGNVWFWNKLYQSNTGENRDWTQIQAWSPVLGISSAQKNARNNDVVTRGGVIMSFRNFTYQGYFKNMQWTMDAKNPFQWEFSFVFQVERTLGQQFIPST